MLLKYSYGMRYNLSSWLGASTICARKYFCNYYCTCPGTSTPPMRDIGLKVEMICDNWEDLVSISFTAVLLIRLPCLSQAPASQCCKGTCQIWLLTHTLLPMGHQGESQPLWAAGKLRFFKWPTLKQVLPFPPMATVPLAREAGYGFALKGREQ